MIKHYLDVTKPKILLGNLISAAGGFLLASRGRIDGALIAATVLGIGLVVASACVFNNCVDRETDRKMIRTRHRVLAQGLLSVPAAVCYGSILGTLGLALLWTVANPLCVAVAATGFAVYVGVYSLLLKRRSVYGALIGSLAGAAPPVAGYCAVSGRFDLGAVSLLLIFGLWQMPHCYAIAIFRYDDYAAAGIPVMPAKVGIPGAKKHITAYTVAFVTATLMPTLAGYTGDSYFAVAAMLGLIGLHLAWSGRKTTDDRLWAKRLFAFSIVNIAVLTIMMSVDFTLPARSGLLPPHLP